MEAAPVFAKPRGAIEHEPPRFVAERAHRRLAADAVPALAARRDVARADVVARGHGLDPGPTFSTTPAASWPSTTGRGWGESPVITCKSLWQTPLAAHRTCTSWGPGSSSSTSSTTTGFFTSYRTAAVTRMAPFLLAESFADSLRECAPLRKMASKPAIVICLGRRGRVLFRRGGARRAT